MADSSPARASHTSRGSPGSRVPYSSPARPELSEFLLESRNSPEAHKKAFEEAQREHERVLQAALHVFELHQIAEENRRVEELERQRQERARAEEKRIQDEQRAEAQRLQDEARLRALKAQPLPKPTLPPAPPAPAQKVFLPNGVSIPPPPPVANGFGAVKAPLAPPPGQPASSTTAASARAAAAALSGDASAAGQQPQIAKVPQRAVSQQVLTQPAPVAKGLLAAAQDTKGVEFPPRPDIARHVAVHKKLKELRSFMKAQADASTALKNRVGDMRREIRKSIGQLASGGTQENRIPINKIWKMLKESLQSVPSAPVDPNEFLLEPRGPVPGATRNEAQLPSLFLYLMNILAKAVISQYINESSADPRTADSIGQVASKVFSADEFLWRGKSLIDVLVAKYCVVCPVLFGSYGSEKTDEGRARLGWRKDGGKWIPEPTHADRMMGLGAGFASITLRNFSASRDRHPWPPTTYWTAMARMLSTPPDQISKTQCTVIKGMIVGFEKHFIQLYGSAALAALRCALVDLPSRVPQDWREGSILRVHAKALSVTMGLRL